MFIFLLSSNFMSLFSTLFSSKTNTAIGQRLLPNLPSKSWILIVRLLPSLPFLSTFHTWQCSLKKQSPISITRIFMLHFSMPRKLQTLSRIKWDFWISSPHHHSCCLCSVVQLEIYLCIAVVLIYYPGWMRNLMLLWQKEKSSRGFRISK